MDQTSHCLKGIYKLNAPLKIQELKGVPNKSKGLLIDILNTFIKEIIRHGVKQEVSAVVVFTEN